jgi:integrase
MGKNKPKPPRTQQNTRFVDLANRAQRTLRKKLPAAPKALKPTKKRKPKPLPKYLTTAEKDALFNVVKSPRDRALFRMLLYHGLRASEIGLLQLTDYRKGGSLDMDRIRIRRLKRVHRRRYRAGQCRGRGAPNLAEGTGERAGALVPVPESSGHLEISDLGIDETLLPAGGDPARESPSPRPQAHLLYPAALRQARIYRGRAGARRPCRYPEHHDLREVDQPGQPERTRRLRDWS